MTERTMARRRRYQQKHRRNTIASWIVGAACITALLILVALGCKNYIDEQASYGNLQNSLPGLTLGESKSSQSPESTAPVYADDTNWNLRLVNRWNPIPEGYTVRLKELPGGEQVDERIHDPLMEMLEAAREGNWDETPRVISGYRTQETQQSLYDEEVNKYKAQGYSEDEAKAEAGKWGGGSRHQRTPVGAGRRCRGRYL